MDSDYQPMNSPPPLRTYDSTRRAAPAVPALPRPSAGVLPPVDPAGNHNGAGRGRRLPLTDYGRHTLAHRLTSLAELLMAERIPTSGDAALDDEMRAIKQDIVRGLLERAEEIAS